MNKKLIRKMQIAAGGPLRIKFTPEQIALFESRATRVPGMNNSGGNRYREEGVLALQHLEQEAKRKEEEIKSRMEMRPTLKRKAEKLGDKDEYELTPLVVGMSGTDPVGEFILAGIGLNGVGALAKTGLWNIAKYAPTTQLGNYGRQYFVGKAFKNSFNEAVPTLTSQATSLLYLPAKLNETGLTSLKFFERKPFNSKLKKSEEAGVPKGERAENNPEVMQNARLFAEKYGYDIPENIDQVKDMYRLHNRFFRTVTTEPFDINPDLYPELKGLSHEQKIKLLASKGYPKFYRSWDPKDVGFGFNDDFVFVSPSVALNIKYSYGDLSNTVMLQRPFSFGKPNEWHINADWKVNPSTLNIHTKGMISEGNAPIYDEAKISTEHLIPIKIAEKTDKGSLKKKQGGKINLLLKFKNGGYVRKMLTAAGGPIKRPIKRLKDGYRYIPDEENGGWDRISDNSMSDVFATMEFTPKKTKVGSSITRKQSAPSKTYYSAYNPDDVVKGFNTLTLGGLNNLSPTQWARRIYDTGKLLNGNMTWSGYTNSWINGNNGLVSLKFSEEHPYLSTGINLVGDAAALGGISGVKKLANISKPNVNVTANVGTTAEQGTTALSLEEILKAFEAARQWHLNRINSPGYTNRALRAGFTEEEIPQLLQLLTSLINRLKLLRPEEVLGSNIRLNHNLNGKPSAGYWRTILNGNLKQGISFYDTNASYDDAVSNFIHEFGHGATFGLNGTETSGYMKALADQFPLINRAVKYNRSLYPEINVGRVELAAPGAIRTGNVGYFASPTEMLSRGYEFMRDYGNNWVKAYKSGELSSKTHLDLVGSRENSNIFNTIATPKGAANFLRNALGISAPLGLGGYGLYSNNNLLQQLQYLKQGGRIRKMQTAAGGPIELYNTLWVDNWRNRLTSPVVVAKQFEKLTNKIPIKYLGGSKDNARKEFWKQEPVLQHAVDSVASLYRINPESLKYRLDKEGFTDRLIKRVNESVKQGTQRVHERGYKLLNDPNYGLAGTQIGLDDARTYIDSGKVKLINENWYEQGPFKNEKGRMTYPVNPVTLNDGIGIVAAHLKYFRDKALLDFPNASEYDLDRYANAYYNRGALGGKKWVKAGAKGYNYRKKGGMLEFLKNGSGIHIKEKNKGKFTSYCGGKVTDECILKGKNSSNPAIRKRATFAANARKWKHQDGGIIKALEGTKTNWWSKIGEGINKGVNSKAGLYIAQGLLLGLGSIFGGNSSSDISNAAKGYMEMQELWLDENELRRLNSLLNSNIDPENPNAVEGVPKQVLYGKIYDIEQRNLKRKLKLEKEEMESQLNTLKSNLYLDIFSTALGMISNNSSSNKDTSNKNTSLNTSTTSNSYFDNYVNTKYKKFGTFNSDGSMNMLGGTFTIKDGYKPNQPQLFNYQPPKLNV